MLFVIDKFKSKKKLQYQKNSPYLTEVNRICLTLHLFKIRIIKIKKSS